MNDSPSEIRATLSAGEIDVLDRVLGFVASRSAGGSRAREVVALLQTPDGLGLFREVLRARARLRGAESPASASHTREDATPAALGPRRAPPDPSRSNLAGAPSTDWPAGEWDEDVARRALAEWAQSGLSETAFCLASGISRGRIRRWRQKLEG